MKPDIPSFIPRNHRSQPVVRAAVRYAAPTQAEMAGMIGAVTATACLLLVTAIRIGG